MVMVRIVYFASFLPLVVLEAAALSSLCSTTNTASSKSYSSLYQSRGACGDRCRGQSAYAVVQDDQCWCSDTTPSSTTDDGSCNKPCPGYPQESCGSRTRFIIIAIIALITALIITTLITTITATTTTTISKLWIVRLIKSISTPTKSGHSYSESRTIIQTVEAPASSIIEENSASFRTVTVTGIPAVSTIAAVADNTNNNNDAPSPTDSPTRHSDDNGGGGGSGLKQGTIVGIAVGGSAAGVFVGLIAFMVWRRNRYKGDDDGDSGRRQSEEVQGVVDYFGTANGATSIKRDNTSASEDSRMGAFGQNKNLYRNSIGSLEDTSSDWGQVLRVVNPDVPEKQH
ncbi:hypothetical protein NHJ6243_008314 [Beauveria neobassiana]